MLWGKLISAKTKDINADYLEEVGDVDKSLEDFYVDSIHEASNQTGVSEEKIRDWFEKNLITLVTHAKSFILILTRLKSLAA